MRSIRGVTLAAAVRADVRRSSRASAQNQQPAAPAVSPWAEWIEPDFPFFSSVLDAGRAGPELAGEEPDAARARPEPRPRPLGRLRHRPAARRRDLARQRRDAARRWRRGRITSPIARRRADSRRCPSPTARSGSPTASTRDGRPARARRSTIHASRRPRPRKSAAARSPMRSAASRRSAWFAAARCSSTPCAAREVREWMTVADGNGRSAIVRNIDVAAAAEPLWLMLGFKTTAGSMSALPRDAGRAWPSSRFAASGASRAQPGVGGEESRRTPSRCSSASRSPTGRAADERRVPGHSDRRAGASLAAGGHDDGHACRPRRTPTSWTTSRCRSTTRGAATCGPATFSSSRTAPASA